MSSRKQIVKLFTFSLILAIVILIVYTWHGHGDDADSEYKALRSAATRYNLSEFKVVMMPLWMRTGSPSSYLDRCQYSKCKFIYSAQYVDAVLSDIAVIEFKRGQLIRQVISAGNIVRRDHPVIILSHESPGYCRWSSASNTLSGGITYSPTSSATNIYYPYAYTQSVPNNGRKTKQTSQVDYTKGKSKGAYVYVSNCHTSYYNRLEVIKQLSKYIDIDIYGACTNDKPCPRRSIPCEAKAHSKYRFYLAFENSLCKDYITEKFWKTLKSSAGFIPVAIGGKSIEEYYRIAPPDSFIHAYNFSSIEKLGNYLRYLMNNDAAFNRYHQWRQRYKIIDSRPKLACDLCKLAHNTSILPPPTNSLADDWNDPNNCAMLQMDDYKPNMGNYPFWRKVLNGFC